MKFNEVIVNKMSPGYSGKMGLKGEPTGMRDILIVAHFTQVPGDIRNGRFHYIAENIDKDVAAVEVVTTSFSHKGKCQRVVSDEQLNSVSYRFTMLDEPGYQANVSLKRIYSHRVVGRNLKIYLEQRRKPDLIYCAVPSLDLAFVAAEYARNNDVPFLIDIQDLWPEAFEMILGVPFISDLLFYPMRRKANFIYAAADEIIAVSQTYVERALRVSPKCQKGYSVFLGTELASFDRLASENEVFDKPEDELWLAYVGSLGQSYDLIYVMNALKMIKDEYGITFVVIGDGPLRGHFEKYAREQDISARFTGRLGYGKMVGLLSACDVAVNPIRRGSAASIINKHADYAAAGLPVLNSQECPEYRTLVEQYQMGFNCKIDDPADLADKLLQLRRDKGLREIMGQNSRRLAEERFDRKKTYPLIIEMLENRKRNYP